MCEIFFSSSVRSASVSRRQIVEGRRQMIGSRVDVVVKIIFSLHLINVFKRKGNSQSRKSLIYLNIRERKTKICKTFYFLMSCCCLFLPLVIN